MQRDNLLDLFQNCDFSGKLTSDNFEDRIIDNLPENLSYKYFFGASKVCIIPEGADYVIKIPFNSTWYDTSEEYEDFCNACGDDRHFWDYCFAEVLCYNEAKREKVNKMFCKPRLLGCVDDYPIYIQQRAVTYYDLKGEETVDARTPKTRDYCQKKGFSCFNSIWIADALEYYGQKGFNRMMSFIKSYGIGDLHDENIGYIGRQPVLIDYSDFCEQEVVNGEM